MASGQIDQLPAVCPLFVPATRIERIDKARASAADAVIVDLEDAVAPADKPGARDALADYCAAQPNAGVFVRINAIDTPYADADRALVSEYPAIAGVMLPRVESADAVAWAAATTKGAAHKTVWALVETPQGVRRAERIASHRAVARLAFGALDFAASTGIDRQHPAGAAALDAIRGQLVLHSAAAGLAAPLDSPHPAIRDTAPVSDAAQHACALGFGGMLAIHPAQLEPIRRGFMPDAATLDWAERVLQAAKTTGGAQQVDGQMIDAPVMVMARRLLARARYLQSGQSSTRG